MWTGLGGGLGPTGTLGQILLNPPGQLFVTTRIPFAPNEGANELGCLPPPPWHPHSYLGACVSAFFFPGRKRLNVSIACLVCIRVSLLQAGPAELDQ